MSKTGIASSSYAAFDNARPRIVFRSGTVAGRAAVNRRAFPKRIGNQSPVAVLIGGVSGKQTGGDAMASSSPNDRSDGSSSDAKWAAALPGAKLEEIRLWASSQPDKPSLSEAVRRLIDLGLADRRGKAR
jgi:hypothetical protein